MEPTPTVHVWHDYVCPFCNVAATRIRRIKQADRLNLDVRFHAWPLEVANGKQPAAEDEDQWVRMLRPLEPEAFADWNPSSGFWPASSRILFAAYEAARAQDMAAAERFDLLLRQAIFQHPRPIDSTDALTELAADAGLDVGVFQPMLEAAIEEHHAYTPGAEAHTLGIRGIPTLVLPDGSTVISPGLKIHRTDQGRSIRDDVEALHTLLRKAAEMAPTGTGLA